MRRSDKAISGDGRFFYSFRSAANRDELVSRRLGATIPGLAEEWHSGAWEMLVLHAGDLQPGSIVCGPPYALEDCGTRLLLAISFGGESLDGFAQPVKPDAGRPASRNRPAIAHRTFRRCAVLLPIPGVASLQE